HSVVVINPQLLIQEAINVFQNNASEDGSETSKTNETDSAESSLINKPSRRAQLGAAIDEQLRTGQELSDEILVQLVFEEIKSLPNGQNFILEGFPANLTQAKLLHRRLTVAEEENAHTSDHSMPVSLQAPVHVMEHSDCANKEQSRGLDIVIFLNVPEDEIFRRAARMETAASVAAETYIVPQENDVVPQDDSRVAQQNSEVLTVVNTQAEQPCKNSSWLSGLHERLEGFLTSWTELTDFYANELHILHEVNVSSSSIQEEDQVKNIEQVYHEVECLIQQVVKLRETSGEIPEQVKESREDESGIPEVEKKDLVLDSAESVRPLIPSSQSPASEIPRTSQTLTQEQDDDEQASRTDSAKLKRAVSARSKSAISSKHSERSAKQQSSNKNSPGPHESSSGSREGSKKERQRADSIGKSRSRPSSNQQNKGRKNAKQPSVQVTEEVTESQPAVTPSSPRPGETNWVYVEAPIEQQCATNLMHYFESSEDVYSRNCKTLFSAIRQVRWIMLPHLYQARVRLYNYLQRPDSKQHFVEQFRTSFNSVLDELRADEETKADLHCRADDLRDTLYEVLDESKAANEAKMHAYLDPNDWLTDKLCLLANFYLAVMQLELARFQDRLQFLRNYYKSMEGRPQTFENESLAVLQGTVDCNNAEFNRLPIMQFPEDLLEDSASDSQSGSRSRTPSGGHHGKTSGSSHNKTRNVSASRGRSHTSATSMPDVASDLDPALGSLPPEFSTQITLLPTKAGLSEIYAALTKSGPGVVKPIPAPAAHEKPANAPKATGIKQVTAASGKPGGAEKEKPTLPSAATLPVDKMSPPVQPEAQFLFNVCLCALQIVNNQYQAERALRAAEAEADGYQTETRGNTTSTAMVPSTKAKRAGSSGKAGRNGARSGPGKISTPKEVSEEEQALRVLRSRIRKEHLAALEKQVSSTVFRLTLVRVQACSALTELRQRVTQAETEMNNWIGERTLQEHNAVNELLSVVRGAIEAEQALREPLILDGDKFYLGQ
ncbi:hypothetical protein P879_08393, partial [Paragonimus westermani]